MQIIDITIPIKEKMPVYPGNPEVRFDVENGKTSTHTRMTLGTHTGTHIDAPKHVFNDGDSIDNLELKKFYGKCRVLDVTDQKEYISLEKIKEFDIGKGERILLKTTNSERGFDVFYDDYVYLGGDAADYLAEIGVVLVGIDFLSIKKRGGSDNRPHTSLLKNNIPIIEGINLKNIPTDQERNQYKLVAFPLKLKDLDGSPARVVLLQE